MSLVGETLAVWTKLNPILQYFEILAERDAGMVGLAISYSQDTVGIIQQFINNFSQLEMELISIERLMELARSETAQSEEQSYTKDAISFDGSGLALRDVE